MGEGGAVLMDSMRLARIVKAFVIGVEIVIVNPGKIIPVKNGLSGNLETCRMDMITNTLVAT